MATRNPRILLVAASPTAVSALAARFKKWECEIQFASSSTEAIAAVRSEQFDLLLSEFKLRDKDSSALAASLEGSISTLIYSYPVEEGCWWLPAVKNGLPCWGSPAMRPGEFMHFMDDFLTVVRLRKSLLSGEFAENLFELTPDTAPEESTQRRRKESCPRGTRRRCCLNPRHSGTTRRIIGENIFWSLSCTTSRLFCASDDAASSHARSWCRGRAQNCHASLKSIRPPAPSAQSRRPVWSPARSPAPTRRTRCARRLVRFVAARIAIPDADYFPRSFDRKLHAVSRRRHDSPSARLKPKPSPPQHPRHPR